MNTREISCGSCHNKIMETPDSKNTLCQSCESLISTEGCETVPKGHLCFCWKTRLQENKSLHAALPKPDRKLNPMTNNIGVHLPKRAVLCGVSYQKKKHKLKGTINDVNRMKSLLTNHFGFLETSICVLTEEEDDPNLIPTKENMQKALRWLVADCKSGDSLVFYFSGHGLRQPDFDMDEIDGYDETICPSDFMTAGMILDNDINNTIVKPLKEGVKLHAIIDACHSGTILDLEHVYDSIPKRWVDNKPPSGVRKSTDGGLAISLSACTDDQMASDTTAFSRNEMTGAMTYIFDQIIRQNPRITYGNLLEKMHEQIKHANSNSTGCLLMMFCHKLIQGENEFCTVDQKLDNVTAFDDLRLDEIEPLKFNFVNGQESPSLPEVTMNLANDEGMEEGFNSSAGFETEAVMLNIAGRLQFTTVCVWCTTEFNHEAVDSETQSDSVGFMCPTCKAKISGQLNVLDSGLSMNSHL